MNREFVIGDRVSLVAGTLKRSGMITRLSRSYADVIWVYGSEWKCCLLLNLSKELVS